ncbi:hypothetical protein [Bifidobacterium oedipodis]|uniref:hypothetical protein n=1 Tax=Bifidobacterium oedipodis TaxID=2675322 RepID=UPI00145CA12C|nr:hypothetical protein [Bifidobacterium sp. DSM 109957]
MATVLAVVFSLLGAFLILDGMDATAPLGVAATVQVSGPVPSVSSRQTIAQIGDIADEYHVNVVKYVDDVRNPGTLRHLYVMVGNTEGKAAQ